MIPLSTPVLLNYFTASPYLISQARSINAGDWSRSASDSDVVIVPDAQWAVDDYVVVILSTQAVTITPPSGMVLLGNNVNSVSPALVTNVFGGIRSNVASWTFTLSAASVFACTALAVSNINQSSPLFSISFNSFINAGVNRDAWPPLTVGDSNGKYLISALSADSNPASLTFKPSIAVSSQHHSWSNIATITRRVYSVTTPIADGLFSSIPPRFSPAATIPNVTGVSVVLNRASGVRQASNPIFSALDSYLSSFSMGYAWIASKNNTVMASNAVGYSRATTESVSPGVVFSLDTIMPIASVTKLMTEVAIRRLIADGYLSLHQTISALLPSLAVGSGVGLITLKQLLQMTSGISASFSVTGAHPATVNSWALNSSVNAGEWYSYQNGNFALVQLIIEAVTGMTYINYMQSILFSPLGMTVTTTPPVNGVLSYRSGGGISGGTVLTVPSTAVGGLSMSCRDVMKFMRCLRVTGVLDRQSLDNMLNDRYRASPTWGLRGEFHQHDGLLLDGDNRGIRTQVLRAPDGWDLVIFTNTYDISGDSLLPRARDCFLT